jgi:hypothetical protein
MTCELPNKTREPSITTMTIGLLLWFIFSSLAVGFVATHTDSVVIQGLLEGLKRSGASFGPTYTD